MNHGKLYGLHPKPLKSSCDIDFFYVTQTITEALIPNPISKVYLLLFTV